jgi:zinc carboxypeptidase
MQHRMGTSRGRWARAVLVAAALGSALAPLGAQPRQGGDTPAADAPPAGQEPVPVPVPTEPPLQDPAAPPAPAPAETKPAETKPDEPAAAPAPDPRAAYLFLEDRDALLRSWGQSGLVERLELGTSAGGRELFGVQFGVAGPRPLAERATLFLVGGLDGVSLSGSQAVIAVVSDLLAHPELLPPEAAFVAIPWANPDGLARWRSRGTGGGRNDRGIDDDGDGQVDEDGPDDLDRDGMILEMLLEDPTGPWVRAGDSRFLRAAREGEAPRYLRLREGADDDSDGSYNEDGPGGVLLDRNFPIGWEDCRGPESGPWPLSEPDSNSLAQLLLARRTAVVLVFQANHGQLATPGGREARSPVLLAEDEPTYRRLAEVFGSHTGRSQAHALTLREARGEPWPGSLVDWSYGALGALAMEVGVWGPEVQNGVRAPVDAYFKNGKPEPEKDGGVSPVEQAWARWLDDTRGGSGFVDWQPIELPGTQGASIGGWERDTIVNPPIDVLPQALRGLDAFVSDLARNLPRLEVDLREPKREGKVCLVKARVKNMGTLPSGVGPGAPASAVRLRLELTPGVTLRAGQLETAVGHLPGRGSSDEYSWLLIAPEGSVVSIVVESAWSPPSVREVRL